MPTGCPTTNDRTRGHWAGPRGQKGAVVKKGFRTTGIVYVPRQAPTHYRSLRKRRISVVSAIVGILPPHLYPSRSSFKSSFIHALYTVVGGPEHRKITPPLTLRRVKMVVKQGSFTQRVVHAWNGLPGKVVAAESR